MDTPMQPPLIVCNVGWMTRYQGLTGQPDNIVGGGKWVVRNKRGHESCNFLPTPSGEVFGHFETSKAKIDRAVNIKNLGAAIGADRIDNADVVWVATNPNGEGRRVIGYYRDATVYRQRQRHGQFPTNQHKHDEVGSYVVSAKAANVRCLALEERAISLGRPPGWIGQTNWWFPERSEHPDVPAFISDVRALLANHGTLADNVSGGQARRQLPTDPHRNALVEESAITMVAKHYAGYEVHSVEKDNVGWDLEIYEKGGPTRRIEPTYRIEVKGLSGPRAVVGVTPNEYRCIKEHMAGRFPTYRIAIVTLALTNPTLLIILYDHARKVWVDEFEKKPVQLHVAEKVAAILSLD
ncbi:protein NO VEIN domain-containing protein [Achromobacter marplatensis]|uniref:protein NO VEIN domain-containing protein n=1 Tax=Achromobacter marplatensis TaxID=470868 RepID=UPI0028EBD577|nr:DUF3883 domain-containing protein [Achromobacter marplatensis]